VVWLSQTVYQQSVAIQLSDVRPESDIFRRQQLGESGITALGTLSQNSRMETGDLVLLIRLAQEGIISTSLSELSAPVCLKWRAVLQNNNRSGYERLGSAYGAIWDDVQCFPVASDAIVYENSWMFERTYGGKRGHEGTDLMPPENISGYYPILSMTDGIVEKLGWLEKGGYRIGIRSPSGGYFYYAHLSDYAEDLQLGDEVSAGTVLGMMGDTGYGPEGTRGQFDVHLHLGIYIQTEEAQELSVNPYWVLRYLQDL
jgi:murein DD-endopeptidase MepM/ murein hydrolase activator NlpD